MNYSFSLQTTLWLAAQVLQAGVLVALVKRGLHRKYSWFTAYSLVMLVSDPFLAFAIGRWDYTYYFGYWITVIATTVLTVGVLYEVLQHVWPSPEAVRKMGKACVWIIVALVIGQALLSFWSSHVGWSTIDHLISLLLLADRDVQIVALGVAVFLLVFRKRLGILGREFGVGIIAGFAVFSAVHLMVATAMAHPGVLHRRTLAAINSGAYVLAELIWLGYAVLSAKVTLGGSGGLGSGGSSPRGRVHAFMGLRWKQDAASEGVR